MAAPALASVSELSEWLGEPITGDSETKRAGWALRMASALVRNESGRTWLDEDGELVDPLPESIVLVTLSAAGRHFINPDAGIVVSESVDDYSYREAERQEVGVYLTTSEKAMLSPFAGGALAGIGTVTTTRGEFPLVDDLSWIRNGPDPLNPW